MTKHPLIITTVIVIIVAIFVLRFFWKKMKKKESQSMRDYEIEKELSTNCLYDITIARLAQHSNKARMVDIVATEIANYFKLIVHPETLSKTFENLGIFSTTKNDWDNARIELSALIQQDIIRRIKKEDLEQYQQGMYKDIKTELDKLNESNTFKALEFKLAWPPPRIIETAD